MLCNAITRDSIRTEVFQTVMCVCSSEMEEGVVRAGGGEQTQRVTAGAVRAQILLHQTGLQQTQARLQTGDPTARVHPNIRKRDSRLPQRQRRLFSGDLRQTLRVRCPAVRDEGLDQESVRAGVPRRFKHIISQRIMMMSVLLIAHNT